MSRMLRRYLENQCDVLEATLRAHNAPGRCTGGEVGPRLIRMFYIPADGVRVSTISGLADNLALALRVDSVRIDRTHQGIVIEIPNPEPRPATLLALLPHLQPWPVDTAALGLANDGTPLLARLASPEVAHCLIAGTTGSGKTVLLRTMAVSLALGHDPAALRLLLIDPKGRAFRPLEGAPHRLRPAVTDVNEAYEALGSLARLMEARDRLGENKPRIVVMVDELADLVLYANGNGSGVEATLARLVQRGREAGIHVIAATQRPSAAVLSGLMRANFPLRLVGRVVTPEDARIATGRGQTGAEKLNGRGDFLAVGGGDTIRFQVAHIGEQEARDALADLRRQAAPMLEMPEVEANIEAGVDAQAAEDGRRLLELEAANGALFTSNRQRETALCGYNGGAATARVTKALAWITAQGAAESATTTTKTPPFLALLTARRAAR